MTAAHVSTSLPTRGASPALARLLALTCALAVVLVAPLARAAAPMCGSEGISVAAPPPVLPIDAGRVRAAPPCGKSGVPDYLSTTPPAEHAPITATAAAPDRVLPAFHDLAVPPLSGLLGVPQADGPALRPGFRSAIFRPPRAS